MRIVIVCLCVLFSISSGAMALPVVFDFSVASDDYRYQVDDLLLQVNAFAESSDAFSITQTGSGLGVSSKNEDDPQLENSGPDEFLQFAFSRTVRLEQVVFSLVDADDDFILNVDSSKELGQTRIWSDTSIELIDKMSSYDFAIEGRLFEFGTWDSKDNFRICGLSVSLPTSDPVPTPEPSTWLLLSTGLAGLVYWRRRY